MDNARWYDPSLGRFAQADTIVPLQQGVQAWDRYAYVNNSPVNYTDPTGHDIQCPENGDCYETCDYNCGSNDGNGGNGGNGGSEGNGDGESDEIPSFDEWVNLCTNDPSNSLCPHPIDCDNLSPVVSSSGSPRSFGCHISHYEIEYDFSEIDWLKLSVKGLSVLGNFVLVASVFGVVTTPAGVKFYSFTQAVSFGYDLATSENPLEPITLTALGEYAPAVSFVLDAHEFQMELYSARREVPIYVPDIPYLGPIQNPILPNFP